MKDDETREMVFLLSNGYCMCSKECASPATDVHHLLPNTKVNKKLYPLFIESIFNKLPLNNGCHLTKPIPTIRPHEAEIKERYLRKIVEEANKNQRKKVKRYLVVIKNAITSILKI